MSRHPTHPPASIATKNDVQTLRKKNLRALIKKYEGPTNLAKELRYSGPSFLSQMIGPNKSITEKTARGIEDILALPGGWMDIDHANAQPARAEHAEGCTAAVDTSVISSVMVSVSAALTNADIPVPLCMPELVSLAYEHAVVHGRVDDAYISRLAKLAVKE